MGLSIPGLMAFGLGSNFIENALNAYLNERQNILNKDIQDSINATNTKNIQDTNATNLAIANNTNQANAKQAELAYQRSLPINQVNNMIAAGMSKPAALSALSGGGSYSAPVIQPATMQAPQDVAFQGPPSHISIGDITDRLMSLPANTKQVDILNTQLDNLRVQGDNMRKEEIRKQELHNAIMDEKRYSKWERESKDEFMSLMESNAQDKNIQPYANESMHDFVRRLGLQDNDLYRKLPVSARQSAFDDYKSRQDEYRAQAEETRRNAQELREQNAEKRAQELHIINSKISNQQLKQLILTNEDFRNAKDARDQEYKARSLRAQVEQIMSDMQLHKEELKRSMTMYQRKDGTWVVQPHKGVQGVAKEFWETIGTVIGLDYAGDIIRGIISIPK